MMVLITSALLAIFCISQVKPLVFGPLYSAGFPATVTRENGNFVKRAAFPQMEGSSRMIHLPGHMKDKMHGVKMGISSDICDNARDNLDVDWDGSPVNYTCYHPKNLLPVIKDVDPIEECNVDKKAYPKHLCMNEEIHYDTVVPTFGNHRPLWPVYGEYVFVPRQRWLHNLEHGAIVMLYHPCVESLEVERLRTLVTGCLRRHIITPYASLPVERPLALVAWGCKLLMNHVDEKTVKKFIKQRALHGPEAELAKQGQYRYKLLNVATTVTGSTYRDFKLCP